MMRSSSPQSWGNGLAHHPDHYTGVTSESTWATLKKEIRHIWGPWEQPTRSQLRTILFEYIETFYNRERHQARLGHRTTAEAYAAFTAG